MSLYASVEHKLIEANHGKGGLLINAKYYTGFPSLKFTYQKLYGGTLLRLRFKKIIFQRTYQHTYYEKFGTKQE